MLTDNVSGERFCSKCGYVVSEELQDSGPEWRSFSKEGGADPTITGAPTTLTIHDRGLYYNQPYKQRLVWKTTYICYEKYN